LLLDEPTANVDPQAEADIYEILHSLQSKMTILMVTHDLSTAIERVQRVLLIQNNLISLKPEEVCQHFAMGLYHAPLIQMPRNTP
jgi:zinc transport system ATP-binding protein